MKPALEVLPDIVKGLEGEVREAVALKVVQQLASGYHMVGSQGWRYVCHAVAYADYGLFPGLQVS